MRGKYLTAALALGLVLGACDSGTSGPAQPGKFSVMLTDAPGDVASAVVTIERIYLQRGEDSLNASGRVDLMTEPVTVDLLDLRNVAMELVAEKTVPGGTYSQMRMVISGGYIEVVEEEDAEGEPTRTKVYASSSAYAAANGRTSDGQLQMPSYAQSGLKIVLPADARRVDGDQQIVLLDFNVAESFGHQAGASGKWVMTPVVHATDLQTGAGAEFSLALGSGVTLPAVAGAGVTLADFKATIDKDGDVITESFVESNGTFKVNFRFLEPGRSYPVTFVAPAGLTVTLDPAFPTSITTSAGATVRQSFTITGATAQ